jgi:hypothetical protein
MWPLCAQLHKLGDDVQQAPLGSSLLITQGDTAAAAAAAARLYALKQMSFLTAISTPLRYSMLADSTNLAKHKHM